MPLVAIQYIGGSDEVHVPAAGVTARRARRSGDVPQTVEIPDFIAGRPPGAWHRPAEGEHVPAGWLRAVDAEGELIVRDPGMGLLAQEDTWRPASKEPVTWPDTVTIETPPEPAPESVAPALVPAPTTTPSGPAAGDTTQEG